MNRDELEALPNGTVIANSEPTTLAYRKLGRCSGGYTSLGSRWELIWHINSQYSIRGQGYYDSDLWAPYYTVVPEEEVQNLIGKRGWERYPHA